MFASPMGAVYIVNILRRSTMKPHNHLSGSGDTDISQIGQSLSVKAGGQSPSEKGGIEFSIADKIDRCKGRGVEI
jgi:hypothetical protein